MLFKDIIGHSAIKKRLINSVIENRVSHAQLFLGPEGSGKLALALAYAQFICCSNKLEDDACGICKSCQKFNKLEHPDLHFFFPNASSVFVKNEKGTSTSTSTLYLADWRSFLISSNYYVCYNKWVNHINIENKQAIINVADTTDIIKKVNIKSYESDYKIILIYMPEKLYHSAAPKLLKVLEEPPEKTLFLLVSENHDLILKTILSRVQLVKITKHTDQEVILFLQKHYKVETQDAAIIARTANGNCVEAVILHENAEENNLFFTFFQSWMRACYSRKIIDIINWIDEFSKKISGREKHKRFMHFALKISNASLYYNYDVKDLVKLNNTQMEFLKKFHPFLNEKNILQISNELNTALNNIERNANIKILLMDLSFKIMRLLQK